MLVADVYADVGVDIDGDGWNDLFFTRIASAPNYWRNLGDGTFEQEILSYIAEPLYSTSWADLDDDGDLDLVGGTYDAELLNALGPDFLLTGRGGVYYYENDEGIFRPQRLAPEAQALALILADFKVSTGAAFRPRATLAPKAKAPGAAVADKKQRKAKGGAAQPLQVPTCSVRLRTAAVVAVE